MLKKLFLGMILVLFAMLTNNVLAIHVWTGNAADDLWTTLGNWEVGGVPATVLPSATDQVDIKKGASDPVLIQDGITAQSGKVYLESTEAGGAVMNVTGGSLTLSVSGNKLMIAPTLGTQATLNMSGGSISVNSSVDIGYYGNATVNMTGGYIQSGWGLYVGRYSPGVGKLNLDNGEIYKIGTGPFEIGPGGVIDINNGVLRLKGDHTATITQYITDKKITGFDNNPRASFNYSYNPVSGETALTAFLLSEHLAYNPSPMGTGVAYNSILSWSPSTYATSHNVYFGTDPNNLVSVSTHQTAISYNPGQLSLGQTYYWRVDEVEDAETYTGELWSFTVKEYIVLEVFESYTSSSDLRITWTEGADALVYLTTATKHGGLYAMQLQYDNTYSAYYSETVRTFNPPVSLVDCHDVKAMELYLHGDAANEAEKMYIELEDSNNRKATIPYPGDANDIIQASWQRWLTWRINLTAINDVNLASISKMTIRFGDRGRTNPGPDGIAYIDDIRLYPTRCIPTLASGNLTDNDCLVNKADLAILTTEWLVKADSNIIAQTPIKQPLAWYRFEDSGTVATDEIGPYDGNVTGGSGHWDSSGYIGNCLSFDASYAVVLPTSLFAALGNSQVTVSAWCYGDVSLPKSSSTRLLHINGTALNAIQWAVPDPTGRVWCELEGEVVEWIPSDPCVWKGKWNHYAVTKNADQGSLKLYCNGQLVGENTTAYARLNDWQHATAAYIGARDSNGWMGYVGKIDEVKIFDYDLSQAEIVSLAGKSEVPRSGLKPDINKDGLVDFRDYAILAAHWLDEVLWP